MKNVALLSVILILLAVSVVPVLAKDHPNGQGNTGNPGQGNYSGVNPGSSEQPQGQNQGRNANNNAGGNGNHGQNRMRTPFYLQGTITAINTSAKTVTVTLSHGNAQVKQYIGKELIVQASDATLIFQLTQGNENASITDSTTTPTLSNEENQTNRVPITFDKLAVGQKVAIHGNLVGSVYTSTMITSYIQTPVGESAGG